MSRIEEDDDEDSVRRDLVNMFREHRSDLSASEKSMMSFCRRVVRLYETTPEHIVRKLWWGPSKHIQLPFENATEEDETYIEYRPLYSRRRRKDDVEEDEEELDENLDDDENDASLSLSAELLKGGGS